MPVNVDVFEYTIGSIDNYSIQSARCLVELLVKNGISTKKDKRHPNRVYIGDLREVEGVKHSLEKNPDAIKCIERWEFNKNYRYSILFDITNISIESIDDIIVQNKAMDYNKIEGYENLYNEITTPSIVRDDDSILIKFNLKISALDAFGNKYKGRYPLLVILYLSEQIMEIRFDSFKSVYGIDKYKYVHNTISWFRAYLGLQIEPIKFEDICDYIKKNGEHDHVFLASQDMRMSSGGKATIDIGNDDNMVLPFIGELKMLMDQYSEDFIAAPKIKQLLEEFIYEKENLSEFPWIKFRFDEKKIEVKFTFEYGDDNVCLLQHFSSYLKSNAGRERMDYVTQYIIKTRASLK